MKASTLKKISAGIPEITNVINMKYLPIFIVDNSSEELAKGFCLYETPYEIRLCTWFHPCVYVPKDDIFIYYDFIDFSSNISVIDKKLYGELSIIQMIQDAIRSSLEMVRKVESLADLANVFRTKYDSWLQTPSSRVNLAILYFYLGNIEECILLLDVSMDEISQYDPRTKDVIDFYQKVKSGKIQEAKYILDVWKRSIQSTFNLKSPC